MAELPELARCKSVLRWGLWRSSGVSGERSPVLLTGAAAVFLWLPSSSEAAWMRAHRRSWWKPDFPRQVLSFLAL